MKWLKKLLGMEPVATSTAPVDAGAKAFDNMAKNLEQGAVGSSNPVTAHPPSANGGTEPAVIAQEVKEVVPEAVKQEEYGSTAIPLDRKGTDEIVLAKPKAPRKPRAKKEENPAGWPFPGDAPAEGKAKPAARSVKAK